MKTDKEITLFTILTGSRLYGTSTDKSDFDYKSVVLPSLDTLLANIKVQNRKEKPIGISSGDKMPEGETETEYLPIQVFLDNFYNVQTYALEIAFAFKDSNKVQWGVNVDFETKKHITYVMESLVSRFLTNNAEKMIGYAVSQSKLYGLKTERYTSLKNIVNYLEALPQETKNCALSNIVGLPEMLLGFPHVSSCFIASATGGEETTPALDICGKKFSLFNKVETVLKSLRVTIDKYGVRVKSFDGEGVDWKALSHAIRITEQVYELSATGNITFPRPNADYLRKIKSGEISLDEATTVFDNAFSKIDEAVTHSVLIQQTPELNEEFTKFKLDTLRKLYNLDN